MRYRELRPQNTFWGNIIAPQKQAYKESTEKPLDNKQAEKGDHT